MANELGRGPKSRLLLYRSPMGKKDIFVVNARPFPRSSSPVDWEKSIFQPWPVDRVPRCAFLFVRNAPARFRRNDETRMRWEAARETMRAKLGSMLGGNVERRKERKATTKQHSSQNGRQVNRWRQCLVLGDFNDLDIILNLFVRRSILP